jgi:hypothetical protein
MVAQVVCSGASTDRGSEKNTKQMFTFSCAAQKTTVKGFGSHPACFLLRVLYTYKSCVVRSFALRPIHFQLSRSFFYNTAIGLACWPVPVLGCRLSSAGGMYIWYMAVSV